MSIIKKEGSYGEEGEDESFSLEILNKFNETDSSTHHKGSQNAEKPKIKINTSHESDEGEDEGEEDEDESEDEKIEQNVIEIWKEWEKVFEIVVTEKEDVTTIEIKLNDDYHYILIWIVLFLNKCEYYLK